MVYYVDHSKAVILLYSYFLCYVLWNCDHLVGQRYLARSLSFIHLLCIHLSLLTLLVSWEASVIPESPEYFISTIFK